MKLTDRVRNAFDVLRGKKYFIPFDYGSGAGSSIITFMNGNPTWTTATIEAFIDEGYTTNALVYAALNYWIDALKQAPLRAYTGGRDNPEPIAPDEDLARLVDRPNPYQSQPEFQSLCNLYYRLAGNAYILLDRDPRGNEIRAMYALRPDYVHIITARDAAAPTGYTLQGYAYITREKSGERHVTPIPVDSMIHVKMPNPADPTAGLAPGIGPLLSAARSVDVDNAYTKYLKLFFERGAMPPGMLNFDVDIDNETIARAQARFTEIYGGYEQWTKPFVTGPKAHWEQIGQNFKDMAADAIDYRNEVRILMAIGVPPILIGARIGLERSTYSNYEQARQAFWEDRVLASLVDFEREYQYYLRRDDQFVAFDLRNVAAFQAIRSQRLEELRSGWNDGAVTRAEYRRAANLPVAARDEVYKVSPSYVFIPTAADETQDETAAIATDNDERKARQERKQAMRDYDRLWKAIDDISRDWETEFEHAAYQAFEEDRRNIMRIVNGAQKSAYQRKASIDWTVVSNEVRDYLLNESPENWQKVFLPVLEGLITDQTEQQAVTYGLQYDIKNLMAAEWFNEYVATFADAVTKTSWDEMAALFQEAQLRGWSVPTTAENLEVLFRQWMAGDADATDTYFAERRLPPHRTMLIARDQVVRASNAGNFALYEQWQVPGKMWLATRDPRVRAAHLAADGQVRKINEAFEVDGQAMLYPGDAALGAALANTIQCRCTTIPVFAEEMPVEN